MLKSMTTYCRLQEEQQGWAVALELRSVNSRFFDLHLHFFRLCFRLFYHY